MGGVTLAEAVPGPITSVAPFAGREAELSQALRSLGLSFPAPNTFNESSGDLIVWTGRDQAFLIGPLLEGLPAATTDQSDGWAALSVSGPDAAAALMRLIPLDLRVAAFPPGRAARAPLNHMAAVIWRDGEGFTLLVFRSMAQTAWHEIETAMKALAARAAVGA
ncbi:sarcosine oxidase subunit gamma [Fertoebacter nigrum]|uniref:Sarcosine oxidase subunit gamma n=2 Tax=Fertoeibacter niger TaxID=2656921 RepID=A0A8X8KNL0_9RHOB|nr:sarcosine oxidase subunit gamma [Fertoeibacter niger]NUB44145.1 sarcosine oxidase subunit gamma [Fertoeibacter niger]